MSIFSRIGRIKKYGPSLVMAVTAGMVLAASFGCGGANDGLQRIPISGTIMIDDQLLTDGALSLTPQASGPACGASVRDGKFDIPKDRGPVAGVYHARVTMNADKSMVSAQSPASSPMQYESIAITIADDSGPLQLRFVGKPVDSP
ncbi:MAG: hypothetical protein R3C05_30910 [Pirellulaceae bacterium]